MVLKIIPIGNVFINPLLCLEKSYNSNIHKLILNQYEQNLLTVTFKIIQIKINYFVTVNYIHIKFQYS